MKYDDDSLLQTSYTNLYWLNQAFTTHNVMEQEKDHEFHEVITNFSHSGIYKGPLFLENPSYLMYIVQDFKTDAYSDPEKKEQEEWQPANYNDSFKMAASGMATPVNQSVQFLPAMRTRENSDRRENESNTMTHKKLLEDYSSKLDTPVANSFPKSNLMNLIPLDQSMREADNPLEQT